MPIAVSVHGGQAHAHVLSPAERHAAHQALSKLLSPETIKVAGNTATAVKAEDLATKSSSTITLADKTTVTLTGVMTHQVVKPH